MRQGERVEIWLFLIDRGPNRAAREGECKKQRVGQVNKCKQKCDQQHASPTGAEDNLSPAVEITLQRILLKKGPQGHDAEPPTPRTIGDMKPVPGTKANDNQRDHDDRRQQQQPYGGHEVVSAKTEVVKRLAVNVVRGDH